MVDTIDPNVKGGKPAVSSDAGKNGHLDGGRSFRYHNHESACRLGWVRSFRHSETPVRLRQATTKDDQQPAC